MPKKNIQTENNFKNAPEILEAPLVEVNMDGYVDPHIKFQQILSGELNESFISGDVKVPVDIDDDGNEIYDEQPAVAAAPVVAPNVEAPHNAAAEPAAPSSEGVGSAESDV